MAEEIRDGVLGQITGGAVARDVEPDYVPTYDSRGVEID